MKKDTYRELPEKQAAHPLLEICGSIKQCVLPCSWITISKWENVFWEKDGDEESGGREGGRLYYRAGKGTLDFVISMGYKLQTVNINICKIGFSTL